MKINNPNDVLAKAKLYEEFRKYITSPGRKSAMVPDKFQSLFKDDK